MGNVDESHGVVFQTGREMPAMREVAMRIGNLRLHAWGVFSNVYRGTLLSPLPEREIAIKKTWPDTADRNFEMIFLTGISRAPHKNIVQMMYAYAKNYGDRVCESFVFEFLPDTLGSVIKSTALDDIDIKLYSWQLFNGLRYLQAHFVVHRDVKPMNILVDHEKGILKIGDFGSAKILKKGFPSTSYQVTRFYRSPELLLRSSDYSWMVDVWSAGCCIGEMMNRRVLFPGRNEKHQLKLIITCLGIPNKEDQMKMKTSKRIKEDARLVPTGLRGAIPQANVESISFLAQILKYRPRERLHGSKLLRHPFFYALFKGGARRSNGVAITDIISRIDFITAMKDEHEKGRQFAEMVMKNEIKFAWPAIEVKESKEQKEVKENSTQMPERQEILVDGRK
ncbi:unnamed protein product [Caenorhabditis auriculariae]|uniref:Protein kinase domain-containing protein n=1 Tax=Caenorhabditis auriculariae TaxID=2777116 RepID=A0A8S1HSY6_9PELO|nr:unnamed protein product [Caenorhabditis auriculariae]